MFVTRFFVTSIKVDGYCVGSQCKIVGETKYRYVTGEDMLRNGWYLKLWYFYFLPSVTVLEILKTVVFVFVKFVLCLLGCCKN